MLTYSYFLELCTDHPFYLNMFFPSYEQQIFLLQREGLFLMLHECNHSLLVGMALSTSRGHIFSLKYACQITWLNIAPEIRVPASRGHILVHEFHVQKVRMDRRYTSYPLEGINFRRSLIWTVKGRVQWRGSREHTRKE